MLVPMPRKIKEMRKNAASTIDTNLTQKLSLSRFIIMDCHPPEYLPTETIVYHVTADDRGRDPPAGGGLEGTECGISVLGRSLDDSKISPFPSIERPRLGLDPEGARPSQRRELEAGRAAHTVHLHREQRLLEEVHARAAPEPVCTHTNPDTPGDHSRHGRDAAPEKIVRTGTVRRRYSGLRQNLYVLCRDSRRQVRSYSLGGEKLYALRVADGREARSSPLVSAEDIRKATSTVPDELDLLGTLGEVDRKRPPQRPRPPRGQ